MYCLRVIYVQNAPEKPSLPSPIAQLHVVPSQPLVGPSQSISDSFSAQPTSSENQFKPYQDGSQDSTAEETSIDLKNVRNLHIFFNDENRIRVQKEDMESCTVDLENINNENIESSTVMPQRADPEGHGTSWHIKIGKTKDPRGKGNDVTMSNSSHRCNDENYGGILVPAEGGSNGRNNNGTDKLTKNNDVGNIVSESPVLKLQIKKAEIVIKFAQKQSNNDTLCTNTSEDKQEEKNGNDAVNIKINNGEKDTSEPIIIDVVKSVDDVGQKEKLDVTNPICIEVDFKKESQEDVPDDYSSPTAKLLSPSLCDTNNREITHSWSPEMSKHSESGSGSQTPLLMNKEKEDFHVNKVD